MTFADLFYELNELDEHPHIEAKTSSQIGESLLETICAYANEPGLGGGYILAGVEQDASSFIPMDYRAVGIGNPDKLQSDIATQCATTFNIPVRPKMAVETFKGVRVLLIHIAEAQPSEKPIYFKSKGLPGGAFRRIGSTDQRCTTDDMLVFYQNHQMATYDETVIADADLTAIDSDATGAYRRLRKQSNPTAAELGWPDEQLLQGLYCATLDKGIIRPTVAGILLFGTAYALRRYFPMMRIDYVRVPGRRWVQDPEKRFDTTIELRGPLLSILPKAIAAVRDDLPKSFNLPAGQDTRQDVPLIPDKVLREAIVNAVMHRTYRIHGPLLIIRYENRIEIRNPGHSLKAPEKFGEPGSHPRNPRISAVLHDTEYAETKGSGIRVMREKMENANLFPPHLESDRVGDQFIVHLLFHHFVNQEAIDWLAHFPEANFTPEDVRAMVFLRETGAIDNSSYRDINKGCDTLTASGRLRKLRSLALLEMKGKGSATYYVPTEKLLAPVTKPSRANRSLPSQPTNLPSLPTNLPSLPTNLPSLPTKLDELPEHLRELIGSIGKRADTSALEHVILQLCEWRQLTAAEVAERLGRSQKYVQMNYLIPMADAGKLARKFPNTKNHPDQAYRTLEG